MLYLEHIWWYSSEDIMQYDNIAKPLPLLMEYLVRLLFKSSLFFLPVFIPVIGFWFI